MAKGDFVFAGPNTDTYTSDELKQGKQEPGKKVAGVTILFLFVTIKLERKQAKNEGRCRETTDCVCKAQITNYSLQANVYVDKEVPAGDKQLGTIIHELYHLKHQKADWDSHKKELDTLLDKHEYPCEDDSKSIVIQDVFAWLIGALYSDSNEEESTTKSEESLEHEISQGVPAKKAIDAVFGPDRLKENAKDAKSDQDLPLAGRFSSRVIPAWDGSCGEK